MDAMGVVFFVLVFGGMAYWMLKPKKAPVRVCATCGHHGQARWVTRGSTLIELVLWLCFLIPGLLYSLWRLNGRHLACPECGGVTLVPATSPKGLEMLRQQQPTS